MYFNSNIRLMRKRRGRTQDEVASSLNMKRPTLSGYENGVAQPGVQQLIAYSEYFGISIDTLVKVDLSKLRESELRQLESGFDVFVKGSKLRLYTWLCRSRICERTPCISTPFSLARTEIPHLPDQRRFDAPHSRWGLGNR